MAIIIPGMSIAHVYHCMKDSERVYNFFWRDRDGQGVAVAERLSRRHDVRNDVMHLKWHV